MAPVEESPGAVMAQLACEKHGKYTAWRHADEAQRVASVRDCPECLADDERQRRSAARANDERRMHGKRLRQIQELSGIPARFAAKSLGDYRATIEGQRVALTICRRYADSWAEQYRKGGSLILTGGVGTGKTHLACAIGNQIMPAHLATVSFGSVSSVVRSVRSTYGGKGSETQALNDLLKPDLLIMDEIGAQAGTDHEMQLVFEIINRRYENLRPMILISNLTADDLLKYLGKRVMDRFAECGMVVACDWASYRSKQQDLV